MQPQFSVFIKMPSPPPLTAFRRELGDRRYVQDAESRNPPVIQPTSARHRHSQRAVEQRGARASDYPAINILTPNRSRDHAGHQAGKRHNSEPPHANLPVQVSPIAIAVVSPPPYYGQPCNTLTKEAPSDAGRHGAVST